MTRVRVLRAITRLNIGGPAIHVALLSSRLDAARYETLLVAGREGRAEGDMLALGRVMAGGSLVRVPTLVRPVSPLNDLRALAALVGIARSYRPHVVHTHLAKAGFVGRLAARLSGARVVVHTYHGSVFRGYFGRGESSLYLGIERALAKLTTRLIAITPRQRQELIDLRVAPSMKIVEIPLGLDLEPFRVPRDQRAARAALGLPADGPLVGLAARLVPVKDVGTFIEAMALLTRRLPAVRALVVGDGEERAALEAFARSLGVAERCRFLGWCADMPSLYAAIDVLALSSLNEGSPVSVIEAMAAARPVVATSVGGVPDVVRHGENGLLVPPRDPEALAEAVETMVRDPALRARLGAAASQAVYPRYDGARLIDDVQRLYAELLDARVT